MFGTSIFGTTPYASLAAFRLALPLAARIYKDLQVPSINLGATAIGVSSGRLVVPSINVGTGSIGTPGRTLLIPNVNMDSASIPED